jgi:hypothetical protein
MRAGLADGVMDMVGMDARAVDEAVGVADDIAVTVVDAMVERETLLVSVAVTVRVTVGLMVRLAVPETEVDTLGVGWAETKEEPEGEGENVGTASLGDAEALATAEGEMEADGLALGLDGAETLSRLLSVADTECDIVLVPEGEIEALRDERVEVEGVGLGLGLCD